MKRKLWIGIGVIAMVGMALWMRELASWRPQIVARLDFMPYDIRLSRDGRSMFIEGMSKTVRRVGQARIRQGQGAILDLQTLKIDTDQARIPDFIKAQSASTYPRLEGEKMGKGIVFLPAPRQKVVLKGIDDPRILRAFSFNRWPGGAATVWSKARREVISTFAGEIFIWDWNSGALKKRLRHRKPGGSGTGVLSPDGQSLLAFDQSPQGINSLRRYSVSTGKETGIIHRGGRGKSATRAENFGWSPDGQYLWFMRRNYMVSPVDFNVLRAPDAKKVWSAPCSGFSTWLPDGRIGLVQKDGFSLRDALGRETLHLAGPGSEAFGWVISPDGNFIYSAEKSGIIRRWRAR